MDKATEPPKPGENAKRRFRGKVTPRVKIEDHVVKAAVPEGSRFKGHEPFLVQDLVMSATATCYRRERWETPDGRTILAPLPEGVDGHFGPELRRFVLMQYHQGQSTLPRRATFLRSLGVAISKRQLQRLLTDRQADFVAEAQDVLRAGLETSPFVSVDDTGAQHAGKNGFCLAFRSAWLTPTKRLAARRSATTGSPGSPRGPRRAGLISSTCCAPATPITCSTTRPTAICESTPCRRR